MSLHLLMLDIHCVILGYLRQKMTKRGDICGLGPKTVVLRSTVRGSKTAVITASEPSYSVRVATTYEMTLMLFYSCALTSIHVRWGL